MAKKPELKKDEQEEVQQEVQQEAPKAVAQKAAPKARIPDGLTEKDMEPITVVCDPAVKINGKIYQGEVTVPKHIAQTIVPMIQAKRRSDLEIFTGKSRLVQKLADGTLVVKDQGKPN